MPLDWCGFWFYLPAGCQIGVTGCLDDCTCVSVALCILVCVFYYLFGILFSYWLWQEVFKWGAFMLGFCFLVD